MALHAILLDWAVILFTEGEFKWEIEAKLPLVHANEIVSGMGGI